MSTNTDDIISGGLFAPIQPLKLNDTFYTWYNTTNFIIDALNPLAIYDVASGPGIDVTKITGGVAVISIKTGCGLSFDSGVSLKLDIAGTPEASEVQAQDYFVFESYTGTNITTDSSDCETLFKVEATNMLPYIVSGDHDFIGGSSSEFKVSSDNLVIDSPTVEFKTTNIYLNNNPETTNDDFVTRSEIGFAGFTVHASDTSPTFGYDGSLLAWKSNQNLSVDSDKSFVSDSSGVNSVFNFSTKTVNQRNVVVNFLTGSRESDTDDGKIFSIKTSFTLNKLQFNFYNEQDTFGSDSEMFSVSYDELTDQSNFQIQGTLYVRDISESSQFLTESDYTSNKVPLTNGYGVLDHKFSNRFVTTKYDPNIQVGDLVRFEYSNYTNTTEDIQIVAAQADTEENSKVIGIVEQIAGGEAIIVLTGVFEYNGESVNITSGDVFYLSPTNAGLATSTKPEFGIIKEVFVGVGPSKGILLSSGVTKEPFFAKVQISGGSLVESESSGDTLILKGGSNVNLEYTSNNEIQINAGSLNDADYWNTIYTNTGSPSRIIASTNNDSFSLLGGNGISTASSSSTITINAPNSYGIIEIVGESTNESDYTLSASSGSDTLTIRSGTGINITSSTNNDIVIEAIGVSVPANRSVGNLQLDEMPAFSIKAAQANGQPVDVYQSTETLEITYPVLAEYYDVYYTTDGDKVYQDPVTLIEYPTIYSEVLGYRLSTGTPDAVAGYVYGRVVDELGNVSDIKPLNRQELRLLIGASETGFLEENNKLFSAWQLFDDSDLSNNIANAYASDKSGVLNIVSGTGITLESETLNDGSSAIKIIATGDSAAFSTIYNETTSESLQATSIGSTINISERDAVGINVTSNNSLDFYIKDASITNTMLADMVENSVKVNTGGTNDPTPIDLYIDENQILGRPQGDYLKALDASEVRTILGLSSSSYYKSFTCYTGSTLVGTGTSSYNEGLIFRGGTNISLTVLGDKSIRIDALTDSTMHGIRTIGFTDSGLLYTPTHLVLEELSLNSANGLYRNIDITYGYNTNTATLTTVFDLGVMPQRSVKVAGTSFDSQRGGYVASNLVLQQGHVLGVTRTGTAVSSIPFSTIVANADLNYFSSATVGNTNIPALGASVLKFIGAGDTSLSYQNGNIVISSDSSLVTDTEPTLGGNLELNLNFITQNTRKSLFVSNTLTSSTNHYLSINNSSSLIELRAFRDTSTASSIDLKLVPYGTGSVILNKLSSESLTNLTLRSSKSDGIIYFDSTNSSQTILSSLGNKSICLSPGSASYDVKMVFDNGTNSRILTTRRNNDNTAIIHSNSVGNLILCAGYTGIGVSTGTTSIQMNSDVLMNSAKSIKSTDNIVKINTTDSGYLKLSGDTKSTTQSISSFSFNPNVSRIIDSFKLTTFGNCVKYIVRGENPSNSDDVFVLEFNVLVNSIEEISDVISLIHPTTSPSNTQNLSVAVSSDGTDVEVSLNTISDSYTLTIYRTSLT